MVAANSSEHDDPPANAAQDSARGYVAPLIVYLIGTMAAAYALDGYPVAYAVVVLGTLAVLWWTRRDVSVIRPHKRVVTGVVVGVLGIAAWIGLSELRLEAKLAAYLPTFLQPEARVAFNPFDEISNRWLAWGFVVVRLTGLVVAVPLAEELFWRGFLLRWTIADRWQQVPLGTFQLQSFLIVTLLFTLAHPEWIAAAVYCILLNGLLYWKRDLWICIVAHAVSNLILAVYVISSGSWWLW